MKKSYKPYHTNNFYKPKTWIMRVLGLTLAVNLFYIPFVLIASLHPINILFSLCVIALFTLSMQVKELIITPAEFVIEVKCPIPFFRGKRSYKVSSIKRIRRIKNRVLPDGSYIDAYLRSQVLYEVKFKDGRTELIHPRLYPQGLDHLIKRIMYYKNMSIETKVEE